MAKEELLDLLEERTKHFRTAKYTELDVIRYLEYVLRTAGKSVLSSIEFKEGQSEFAK